MLSWTAARLIECRELLRFLERYGMPDLGDVARLEIYLLARLCRERT